ncbi:MAG: translation initiation factor IF-2 subunit beta [Halobacteriales archaeon]|nr:translation initiation factor IF-2 subunit beta [Halobacteriales archaeon]
MEYDELLDRALDESPELAERSDRLSVPDPVGETDGAFTRLTNLNDIAQAVAREPEHLHRTIQRELGTNGQFDGQRARYNGSFTIADFDAAVQNYIAEYVTCSQCGLPDTRLVTENGTQMLRCEACGAFRPVEKQSSAQQTQDPNAVEEGQTYEVEITDTGRKGDGVAKRGKYTIFVPGAQVGQTVRIQIENISGTLAFSKVV